MTRKHHFYVCANLLAAGVVDRLTYALLKGNGNGAQITMHQFLSPSTSIVAQAQSELAQLLHSFHEPDPRCWALMDRLGVSRPDTTEHMRRYQRREIVIFACAVRRRWGLMLLEPPCTLHYLHCEICNRLSPGIGDRTRADLNAHRPCDLGSFTHKMSLQFPRFADTVLLELALRCWEKVQRFNSKRVEGIHAKGKRCCASGRKGKTLATMSRAELLGYLLDHHVRAGGRDIRQPYHVQPWRLLHRPKKVQSSQMRARC